MYNVFLILPESIVHTSVSSEVADDHENARVDWFVLGLSVLARSFHDAAFPRALATISNVEMVLWSIDWPVILCGMSRLRRTRMLPIESINKAQWVCFILL